MGKLQHESVSYIFSRLPFPGSESMSSLEEMTLYILCLDRKQYFFKVLKCYEK